MLDFTNYPKIPTHTRAELTQYLEDKIRPGRFLYSVLSNNLVEAVTSADAENLVALRSIVKFLLNKSPPDAWGSPNKVNAYLKKTQTKVE